MLFRSQTFPDNFVIKGGWGEAMRQIGNAVPVLLAESMGYGLIKIIDSTTIVDRRKIFAV